MALHIVLVEPEIPANTGNIARTCAATGTHLHLVRPLGFRTDDATLKEQDWITGTLLTLNTTTLLLRYLRSTVRDVSFTQRLKRRRDIAILIFKMETSLSLVKETKGLSAEILEAGKETKMRMPMSDAVRSLNLSNSAAIIVYEALRQLDFPNLV